MLNFPLEGSGRVFVTWEGTGGEVKVLHESTEGLDVLDAEQVVEPLGARRRRSGSAPIGAALADPAALTPSSLWCELVTLHIPVQGMAQSRAMRGDPTAAIRACVGKVLCGWLLKAIYVHYRRQDLTLGQSNVFSFS
jgi:hypothetical protein